MKLARAMSKLRKHFDEGFITLKHGNRIYVTGKGNYHGSFAISNGGDDYCHNFHVYYMTDKTDLMNDYFDGYFVKNLTQFIRALGVNNEA